MYAKQWQTNQLAYNYTQIACTQNVGRANSPYYLQEHEIFSVLLIGRMTIGIYYFRQVMRLGSWIMTMTVT